MIKDFKTATYGTGNTSATGKFQFLLNMLRREALREFTYLAGQVGSTTNRHLKFIKEGLLGYFSPINALIKKKCVMIHAIREPLDILFNIFAAGLT